MTTPRRRPTIPGAAPGTVPLGRIAGVPIGAHWSVLGIVALLAVAMALVELPALAPGHRPGTYAAAGLVAALLLVLSLLAHETAHAVVARRSGLRVDGVTLWVLGGATLLRGEPDRPGVELRIAGAGPLTSGLLAAAFLGAADLLPAGPAAATAFELAWMNLVLAGFNLLPAAPLDGGRVLHALLWARRGDRWGAASASATAGRVLGRVLVLGGLVVTLVVGFAGLWLVLVGWWISTAAEREGRRARVGRALDGVTVAQVMRPAPGAEPPGDATGVVRAGAPLLDVVGGLARPDARLVVLDESGRAIGVVSAADVLPLLGERTSVPAPPDATPPEATPPDGWWWPGDPDAGRARGAGPADSPPRVFRPS